MKLVTQFIMERLLPSGKSLTIYPSVMDIFGPVNVRTSKSLFHPVSVPGTDLGPKPRGHFQILQGDCNVIATLEPATFDAVVSVFYLDACGSLLGAIDGAHQALRDGGVWISLGPLEYNGTDGGHVGDGMRLCGDEVLQLIARRGFEIVEVRDVPCAYTQDRRSMLQQHFDCLFFVARKLAAGTASGAKSKAGALQAGRRQGHSRGA